MKKREGLGQEQNEGGEWGKRFLEQKKEPHIAGKREVERGEVKIHAKNGDNTGSFEALKTNFKDFPDQDPLTPTEDHVIVALKNIEGFTSTAHAIMTKERADLVVKQNQGDIKGSFDKDGNFLENKKEAVVNVNKTYDEILTPKVERELKDLSDATLEFRHLSYKKGLGGSEAKGISSSTVSSKFRKMSSLKENLKQILRPDNYKLVTDGYSYGIKEMDKDDFYDEMVDDHTKRILGDNRHIGTGDVYGALQDRKFLTGDHKQDDENLKKINSISDLRSK